MNSKWIWEDSTWIRGSNWKPEIVVFARSFNDPTITRQFTIRGFEPYFYAPASATMIPRHVVRVDSKIYTDALGRNVKKCFVTIPTEVRDARQSFDWTDEADILFDKRFMVDRDIEYAFEEDPSSEYGIRPCEVDRHVLPRVCYFDIEVRSPPDIFPKPEEARFPIVSIQCRDSYTGEVRIFTYGVPQVADDQVVCVDEVELLERSAHYIHSTDFDVVSGWYSQGFDIPYIVQRAALLNADISGWSRVNDKWNAPKASKREHGEWSCRLVGRQHADMQLYFKKWYKAEGEMEFNLKHVAKTVVGFEYIDYGDRIDSLFNECRWDDFLQYCRNDLIALEKIDQDLKLFDFYEGLRVLCGVKFEETLQNSKMIESILMRNHIKPMPTRVYGKTTNESFEGALVLNPPIGIHDNVGVVDLAALYPTIIIAFDVSPDVDHTIPKVIGRLMAERERLRAIKLRGEADESTKKKEVVLKFIINSFYGVLGWPAFRLYNPENAAFITGTGREINRYLQEVSKRLGYEPTYGDTDSLFIKGIATSEDGLRLQGEFNAALREWATEKNAKIAPTLKFEKLYRRIVFKKKASKDKGAAKKRYAGHLIWKDGSDVDKLDFTGIELKRSDQADITKLVMRKFLEELLLQGDIDAANRAVEEVSKKVRGGEVSIHSVAIPKGGRSEKGLQRKRGIENTQRLLGWNVPEGIKPRLVHCLHPVREICIFDEIPEDEIRGAVEVDWKMMSQKTVEAKMKSFIESIGCDWNVVVNGQRTFDEWL